MDATLGLHELVWQDVDGVFGEVLVASPTDANGRGIDLRVALDALGYAGAKAYLVWRHRELRVRGCEPFSVVDAAAGRFQVFYPAAMCAGAGMVDAQVVLSLPGAVSMLSSRAFEVRVEPMLIDGAAASDGFTLFAEILRAFEEIGGIEGLRGEVGPAGADGPAGPAGPQGEVGPMGPAGPQGADGAPGRDGRDGVDGTPGAAGPAGPMGPQGPQGEAGPAGPQGPAGADATPADLSAYATKAYVDAAVSSIASFDAEVF